MSDWMNVYGCNTEKYGTIHMCGGCAEWWNYKLLFHQDSSNYTLYKEDANGMHEVLGKLILNTEEEQVREVYGEYNLKDDEIFIDYEFFCWED